MQIDDPTLERILETAKKNREWTASTTEPLRINRADRLREFGQMITVLEDAKADRSRVAELEMKFAAAVRIIKDDYNPWANSGGPRACAHGYGAGIPCPDCDRATLGID